MSLRPTEDAPTIEVSPSTPVVDRDTDGDGGSVVRQYVPISSDGSSMEGGELSASL